MLEFETELSNLMSILKDGHKEYLEVNDDVIHKTNKFSYKEDERGREKRTRSIKLCKKCSK